MGSAFSSLRQMLLPLPPLSDFFPPTPEAYAVLLFLFQYFPVFTTLQWLLPYHPAGKTSLKTSRFNIPGKPAWFLMEIISPITLVYILFTLPNKLNIAALPLPNKAVAFLFVVHYLNRAVVSPLWGAPSMSPIHVLVVVMAGLFNFVNASCIAGWLVGYSVSLRGWLGGDYVYKTEGVENRKLLDLGSLPTSVRVLPNLGVLLFVVGMVGNIYSERRLFRLRREEGERRASAAAAGNNNNHTKKKGKGKGKGRPKKEQQQQQQHHELGSDADKQPKNKYDKVYVLPPSQGIFRSILYPHYVFEWLEWLGFALVGTAVFSSRQSVIPTTHATPSIRLVPWLVPFAVLAEKLQVPLPLPAVLFFVNAVANMLPHARWGRKWYVGKFGEEGVAGRGAVVPWCRWL